MKNTYTVILFYKFTKIKNPERFRDKQKKIAAEFGLLGRMLVAPEGINATFEGTSPNIKKYIKKLRTQAIFRDVVFKESVGNFLFNAEAQRVKESKGLMLEFEEGIFLPHCAERNLCAQVVDVEKVLLPETVDRTDEDAAHH